MRYELLRRPLPEPDDLVKSVLVYRLFFLKTLTC